MLRDGRSVGTLSESESSKDDIIRRMVGREIQDLFPRRRGGEQSAARPAAAKRTAVEVVSLTVADPHTGKLVLRDISFAVAPGEVLGIGGLMGAGRTELLMHIFGAWGERRGGHVLIEGKELPPGDPVGALRRGLALVSEDRRRYGLILDKTINFNLSLSSLPRTTRRGFIDRNREFKRNRHTFEALRVKAPSLEAITGNLSGGNQQKVVFGKALLCEPSFFSMSQLAASTSERKSKSTRSSTGSRAKDRRSCSSRANCRN